MALTEEEKNKIRKSLGEVVRPQSQEPMDRKSYIKSLVEGNASPTMPQTGFKADLKGIGTDIKSSIATRGENMQESQEAMNAGEQGAFRTGLQKFGQFAGGVSDVIGSTVMGGIKALTPQPIQEKAGEIIQSGVQKIAETEQAQKLVNWYQNLDEKAQRDIGAIAGITSLATDVVGGALAKKPAQQAIGKVVDTVSDIPRATQKLSVVAKEAVKPTITPKKAVEEVLQAKAMTLKQTESAIKTLQTVDTSKVKTFADLGNKIDSKITELAKQVDSELSQDLTKTTLDGLTVTKTSKGGQAVTTNYVQEALDQLEELYDTIGDAVQKTNIQELREIAMTQGLTKLEVNDIARTYGQEFGQKAFSKIGEPLTSVNAQRFENVRKGIKDVARSGITGAQAKAADEAMSRLYNIQRLVKKNVEQVNRLMNRIEDRGLLEKVGHAVSKYADVLTGGSLRGIVGGLLPRGAGYKTLNAIDLESLLERNLKIINEASKAKTVKQFNETINKLNLKEVVGQSTKGVAGTKLLAE